ncbi:MAG: RNA polymerase sigma factor [Isosphaeraceae bacterium]
MDLRTDSGGRRVDRDSIEQHLSQITTAWTVLGEAHGLSPGRGDAQSKLIQRYGAPVYRYLLAALRDQDAADELFQEFALRFIRGDFQRADSERGRFRDYLKTSLFRLIIDARRRQKRSNEVRPLPQGPSGEPLLVDGETETLEDEADEQFLAVWRAELIATAWDSLKEVERRTGQPLHTVLRLRGDEPSLRSAEMAQRLSERLGRPLNAGWVLKKLLLAREEFTDALLEAVTRSVDDPSHENIEDELIDLGLLEHCRDALERRRKPQG